MEELFFENFSKRKQYTELEVRNFGEVEVLETKAKLVSIETSPSQVKNQNFFQGSNDILIEMSLLLDRLEKEIEKEYLDVADYRCIFNKIREEFKKMSINGVLELLDHLEELLDLGVPAIILKSSLKSNP